MINEKKSEKKEFLIFHVDELICGVFLDSVQEVNKHLDITQVFLAPPTVRGIINLRGDILTLIDLRQCFGFQPEEITNSTRNVVIRNQEELAGLLVDSIEDIVSASADDVLPAPPHLQGQLGDFVKGVYRMQDRLISILNVEKLWTI